MPVITLDNTNTIITDTFVSQASSTTPFGTAPTIQWGNGSNGVNDKLRALLKFDLGLVPNDAIINSATLYLFNNSNGITRQTNIHRVTDAWDNNTTWNLQPSYDPTIKSSFSSYPASQTVSIDIKNLVQEWVNGAKNFGLMLKDFDESVAGTTRSAHSSEALYKPHIIIDYTIPTTGKKQVEYVGNSTAGAGSSVASITVPLPTGTTVGDLLIAEINSSSTGTINLPSGWTMLTTGTSGTTRYAVAYKFVQSGDGGQVFSNTSGPTAWSVAFHLYRNVKQVQTYVGSTYTSPVSSFAPSGFAAQTDNVMMVLINQSPSGTVNFTNPLSTTEALDVAALGAGAIESSYRYLYKSRSLPTSEMSSQVNGTSAGMATAIALEPIANNPPTLTLTNPADNLSLTEGSTYKLEGTVSDADAGQALSVKYSIGGGPTQSIALGTSDGTTAKSFSKVLTYAQGRFWDGSTDVSGLLPAEASSIQIWANDGSDDSTKVTRNFTVQQEDGKMYVPVNVVNQAYLVSQMAPPVRLTNGWLVGIAREGGVSGYPLYVYKTSDNGKTWTQLTKIAGINVAEASIQAKGTKLYILYAIGMVSDSATRIFALDCLAAQATYDGNTVGVTVDSAQKDQGSRSLAITPDGTRLWWAASTKNSMYPNSFNIRAGSIPILADGSLGTPSAIERVTGSNHVNQSLSTPSLLMTDTEIMITVTYSENNASNRVLCFGKSAGFTDAYWGALDGWKHKTIYTIGYQYPQSQPISCKSPTGKLHVIWHGTDSSDTVNPYIRYSNSTDGTTWLATPRKLVKGQNASITSDKNGKLIITYEDGGYIKRIESSNEFVSYSGPFVVGAGTVPASFYDPTFTTDFSVPPTFYQVSGAVKYYGVLNLNKKPVVTLTTPDNQTLTENATLSVAGSTLDGDPGNVVTTWYKINSGPARALQSGISDGSTPLSFARDLRYSGKRMWDGAVDVAGADLAENTDHTLAVWAEDDKGGKSAEVTRKFRVVWNRPPTISGQNSDLGTLTERPTVTYSAADPEGNSFTFTEYLNGQQVRSFAGTGGQQNTFELTHDAWIKLDLDVQHQLKIIATDSAGISAERVYTFTRTETHLEFMLDYNNPDVAAFFTVDGMPERILFTLERYLPPDSEIESVLVTNNYLDATPTWEDARNAVIGGRGYIFTNKTKTAADWAICVWVTLAKGSATQRVHVYGYGGAFD